VNNKYYGKYRGFVSDNKDPDKRARCRLLVPNVLGDIITDWAYPCNNLFFGMIMIPKKKDPVWVEFENGDIQKPLYTCSWYAKPSSNYPVPPIARGEGDETTNKGGNSFTNGSGASINEPNEPYSAEYPHDLVMKTLGKITIELDDTPGKERVKLFHPSGTMIEIHPNGEMVKYVKGDEYIKNSANKNNEINGTYNIGIDGNKDEKIQGNHIASIGSNQTVDIGGNKTVDIGANKEETITGNNTKTVSGSEDESVLLGKTSKITIQNDLTVTGINKRTVTGLDVQTIGGIKQLTVAGALVISAASITLTTPSGSFSMVGGVFDFNIPQCNFNIDTCNFNTDTMDIVSSGAINRTSNVAIVDQAPTIDHV